MCVFCTSYIGDVQCSYIFSDYILICVGVCVREGESSAPVKLTAQEIRAIKITISVNIKTDLADPTCAKSSTWSTCGKCYLIVVISEPNDISSRADKCKAPKIWSQKNTNQEFWVEV